jgi:SAM-dependent methyltransferase
MKFKQKIMLWLRASGLLMKADFIRYLIDRIRFRKDNRQIELAHPNINFPPSYLAYDAYSSTSHAWYLKSGAGAAKAIWGLLVPLMEVRDDGKLHTVVEWGCGPARIIRHLPGVSNEKIICIGTDYNRATVEWCKTNVPGIQFEANHLTPPLPLPDACVDALYCVSVFTHLSETMHYAWMKEIFRVMRPGGVVVMALNGDRFQSTLNDQELALYSAGEVVVRGNVLEGSRTYLAFHSPRFVTHKLIVGFDMLEHNTNPNPFISSGQDIWVLRKPNRPI